MAQSDTDSKTEALKNPAVNPPPPPHSTTPPKNIRPTPPGGSPILKAFTSVGKLLSGPKIKKLARQALTKITIKLGLTAATGGIGGTVLLGIDFLKKYGKKILKALTGTLALFFIQTVLPFFKSLGAISSVLGGSTLAYVATGSPIIAAGGAIGGYALHSAVEGSGGYTAIASAAGQKATRALHAFTTASATPGLILFSVLGTFSGTAILTWFGMSHMLAAFVVPNPQGTTTSYPQPLPPAPPIPTNLDAIIQEASDLTCTPPALLKAIIERETSALNYSSSEVSYFSNDSWWLQNASPSPPLPNCYQDPLFHSNSAGTCQRGYCYDTCSTTNCSDSSYDVAGATQFRRQTFYGNGCNDPQGQAPGCQGGYATQVAPHITPQPGDPSYPQPRSPNRCNLRDAILAQAFFIQKRSGFPTHPDGSCTPDPSYWTSGQICVTARSYCGSCGQVEEFQNQTASGQPIKNYYPCGQLDLYLQPGEPGYASPNCGSFDPTDFNPSAPELTANYCDSVYYNYQSFL